MSTTSFIERCIAAGMPVDMALKAAKAFEAEIDVMEDLRRSKDRERQARHRASKQSEPEVVTQCHVTNVTDVTAETKKVSPTPPSKNNYPSPPLKGGISPFDLAWKAYPDVGRRRSSAKKSQPQWNRAMRAVGEDRLLRAVERYADSPDARKDGGEFVPAFDRWLRDGKFEHWLEPEGAEIVSLAQPDDPWPARMRAWEVNRYWNTTDWGPKPGKPGYLGPAEAA